MLCPAVEFNLVTSVSCPSCFCLIHSACHCVHCGPSDTQFMKRHSYGYLPTCRISVEYKLYTRYAYSIGLSVGKVIYPADYSDWSSERVRSALWALKFIWIIFKKKKFVISSSLQRLVFMIFVWVHLMTFYSTITSKVHEIETYNCTVRTCLVFIVISCLVCIVVVLCLLLLVVLYVL